VPDPNEERLTRIWEEHSGRVLAYAARRLGSEEAAKDVVADTFLQAWRRLDVLPEDSLPWLLGAARRVISHEYRSARGRQALFQKLERASIRECGDPVEEGAWAAQGLVAAYGSLKPADQEILALADWEGLSNEQAAVVVRCSVSTFAVRLHRARNRLKQFLAAGADGAMPTKLSLEKTGEAR
jgi:RNA polymerase sigma-70 factor (ECF subfamily)